jgi:diguanylate cyclase (GGDEF)-like protein
MNSVSNQQSLQSALTRFRNGFVVLLLVTIVSLVWQHVGMERVVEFNGGNLIEAAAGDDRENGGTSVASLQHDGSALHLSCNLVRHVQWPYCRLRLSIGAGMRGMDLTRFDRMSLDLKYIGPGARQLRLYLIDFERGVSHPSDFLTNKFNELQVPTVPENGTISFPLRLFYTASWWKDKFTLPLEQTGVRYDNVVAVDLLTGGDMPTGSYEITLKALRLHGKWISLTQLLTVLVLLWIVWPLTVAVRLHRQLDRSNAQLSRARELNRALQLEASELACQVHVDSLTQVLNREGLHAFLMNSGMMQSGPMSVIFTDIDHFKRINDTHGHAVGDVVLKSFAQTIVATVRSTDRVVRWGGEEFLIVCMNTTEQQACMLAEKLREHMGLQAWPAGMSVTASFGVAEHLPTEEVGEVIERADAALYAAKRGGRNRVSMHGLKLVAGQSQSDSGRVEA